MGPNHIIINHQLDITTFKNSTVTKMVIKQASALNENFTKPVTCIREASKQGSSIIRKGTAIKNIIKSGSTRAQEIMTHDPWLASTTPSDEANLRLRDRIGDGAEKNNIKKTLKQHWRKRESDIDGDLFHFFWGLKPN
jgi:hypothetical protein